MILQALVALVFLFIALTAIGAMLAWLARADDDDAEGALIERVNALLPQTQCAQCGYPGCRPYAQAIIADNVAINRCPPGGETTIAQLADLLGRQPEPLNETLGEHKPPQVARIDEATCIGCTLCIKACPVDAIVGASRYMHTVISEDCTGCELCLPPCPVDCIELLPRAIPLTRWQWPVAANPTCNRETRA